MKCFDEVKASKLMQRMRLQVSGTPPTGWGIRSKTHLVKQWMFRRGTPLFFSPEKGKILGCKYEFGGNDASRPSRLVAGKILACHKPTLSILNRHSRKSDLRLGLIEGAIFRLPSILWSAKAGVCAPLYHSRCHWLV